MSRCPDCGTMLAIDQHSADDCRREQALYRRALVWMRQRPMLPTAARYLGGSTREASFQRRKRAFKRVRLERMLEIVTAAART